MGWGNYLGSSGHNPFLIKIHQVKPKKAEKLNEIVTCCCERLIVGKFPVDLLMSNGL